MWRIGRALGFMISVVISAYESLSISHESIGSNSGLLLAEEAFLLTTGLP